MTWHILGAGSLGCLWASRLALAGLDAHLLVRPRQLQALQERHNRLTFTNLQGTTQSVCITAETAASNMPIRHLVLACKAYAASNAVAEIKPRLTANATLILLQNGIGSQQEVAQQLPGRRIIVASTTEGAYMPEPLHCRHAGAGITLLGVPDGQGITPAWTAQLDQAQIPWEWSTHITEVLWRKLAINCLINPLTVLHNCPNGELARQEIFIALLAGELAQLLEAAGQPGAAQNLLPTTLEVIRRTAANRSSMLQDVQQRRRTEISYMTGFALARSIELGTAHQHLSALHQKLQQRLGELGLPID